MRKEDAAARLVGAVVLVGVCWVVFTQVGESGARRIAFVSPDGTGLHVVGGIWANMPRVQP